MRITKYAIFESVHSGWYADMRFLCFAYGKNQCDAIDSTDPSSNRMGEKHQWRVNISRMAFPALKITESRITKGLRWTRVELPNGDRVLQLLTNNGQRPAYLD